MLGTPALVESFTAQFFQGIALINFCFNNGSFGKRKTDILFEVFCDLYPVLHPGAQQQNPMSDTNQLMSTINYNLFLFIQTYIYTRILCYINNNITGKKQFLILTTLALKNVLKTTK